MRTKFPSINLFLILNFRKGNLKSSSVCFADMQTNQQHVPAHSHFFEPFVSDLPPHEATPVSRWENVSVKNSVNNEQQEKVIFSKEN